MLQVNFVKLLTCIFSVCILKEKFLLSFAISIFFSFLPCTLSIVDFFYKYSHATTMPYYYEHMQKIEENFHQIHIELFQFCTQFNTLYLLLYFVLIFGMIEWITVKRAIYVQGMYSKLCVILLVFFFFSIKHSYFNWYSYMPTTQHYCYLFAFFSSSSFFLKIDFAKFSISISNWKSNNTPINT